MRLNVYLAHAGICSRRKADQHIFNGDVRVNNKVVKEPWFQVLGNDKVVCQGKSVSKNERKNYVILNKPQGYTCTLADKFAVKKITDLIPKKIGRVYPVGRLDKESKGLILLTNDGEFTQKIIHPKSRIEKEYIAWIRPAFLFSHYKEIREGVLDEGEILKVKSLRMLQQYKDKSRMKVILTEGKKRHIRRFFRGLDYKVLSLQRVRIGDLRLGNLKEGECKVISVKNAEKTLGK